MPITWQNVNGPSLAEAAAPMAAAQRSFDTAFARLGDELGRRQVTQDQNFQTGKTNNTEAFLAQLSQYRTPEALAAAQQSGELDALRSGFGGQIDQAAVRQAQELRPGLLQERVLREGRFGDDQQARADRPVVEALQAAITNGDSNAFNTLIQANPNLRNRAELVQAWAGQQRNNILAQRGDTKAAQEVQTFNNQQLAAQQAQALYPLQKQEFEGRIANDAAQAESNRVNALTQRAALEDKRVKALKDAETARLGAVVKDTVLADGTLDSSDGKKLFQKAMVDAKLGEAERVDLLANLEKYAPGGVYKLKGPNGKIIEVPVPTSVAIDALNASSENWGALLVPGWSRRGDDFDNQLRQRLKDPGVLAQIEAVGQAKAQLMGAAGSSTKVTPQEAAYLSAEAAKRLAKFGDAGLPK